MLNRMIARITHLIPLRKGQLSLFDDFKQPAHQEIHHREGTTRHTANGGTVQVAATMAKVQVRGKEGERVEHGRKIYYKLPDQPRKKKGTIVGGSHEEGYVIQPVRQGYTLRPPKITAHRDHIWTEEEHTEESAPSGTRETTSRGGSTISTAESRRRAEVGQQRAQLEEGKVLTHPVFVSRMKSTLSHLASSNGYNPNYATIGGALHNDDPDANELYSEYIAAAMNSYRTETSKAPEEDLEELRDALAGKGKESRILVSMTRAGKTAALRHIIAHQKDLQEHTSYDGTMEDDQESGMRAIAGQRHSTPEHESEAAKQAQLAQGIVGQLEALDDPTAAAIIKMKFGLDRFEHGYKEQDIAAALNRASIPAPKGERWDAEQVKARMASALANLAKTRSVQDLRGLLKSLQELNDLRKACCKHQRTACIDFDGPLADYSQGFLGLDKFGAPVDGAAEGMCELKDAGWKLIIHTTRPDTPALRAYLADNGIPFDEINTNSQQPEGANPGKPIADLYLDDRAVRFNTWGKALVDINRLHKSIHLYAPTPIDDLMERYHLIKSHIKQYARQDGTVVQEHDDRRVKKHQDVIAHENKHGDQVHPGSTLKHGEELTAHLREQGWKEKETHPVKRDESLQVHKKEDLPEPAEVKGSNKENPALISAQRIIHKMHEAVKKADDPVAALTAIHTSRGNPYLKAVDDEREKLLAHFGHKVDRDATATKYEKDGHTLIIGKEGNQHKVHFAGVDPDKAKGQVTSLAGRKKVEETDTGKKDAKFIVGRPNRAYTAKLNEVRSKYALVEADQLTTSHTIQGHINRAYPQEIQPRERERLSSQMQMANIMNDVKPELFGHSATAADGAPIVGKDGAVESGNGRTIALTEAYKRGLADHYKEWLQQEAEHFGLKPEDVQGMKQPMLVRLRDEDDPNKDRAEFAREANQSSNLGSSPAEQAWSDADRIDDTLLKKFTPDEDGEIYNDDNMEFINGFLGKLGKNEAASLRDADGDPNRKCIERIQNAVFTKVYGSSVLTELQAESAKPKIRNILRALNACVGDFAQVKGHDDLDVIPDMMEAIEYTLAHQGQSRAELEHTLRNAGSLNFTGDTPTFKTDYAVEMILAIADRTGSRNRLENVFKGISHAIKTEVHDRENPEVDMFSGPAEPKSKETVVKQALQKVNSGGDEIRKAQSFQPRGLSTMLLKHIGGRHGRERALPAEARTTEASAAGSRPFGRGRSEEEQGRKGAEARENDARQGAAAGRGEESRGAGDAGRRLIKGHVRSYERITPQGALVHVMEHEDSRVSSYGHHLASTKTSYDLHHVRRARFGHLPHWGKLDETTRLQILDAEDAAAEHHAHQEAAAKERNPMAEHLPGDRSGMLQMRMFKSRTPTVLYLLRKSQLDLFSWASEQPKHEEQRTVHASQRHLASGAVVQVTEHERKTKVAQKPQPKAKEGTSLKHSDENYRYRDIGHVPGSRKEIAAEQAAMIKERAKTGAGVGAQEINWDALEENPREAYDLITKEAIAKEVDWDALKAEGVEPAAGFLLYKLYAAVAPKPEDKPEARKDFVFGINALQERFEGAKTVEDVVNRIKEIREEMTGFLLTPEQQKEYDKLRQTYEVAVKEKHRLQREADASWKAYYEPEGRLNSMKWDQQKRTRRGWKPDPELQERIDALQKDVDAARAANMEWRDKNQAALDAADNETTRTWRELDAFRNVVTTTNILSHPLTRGWNSFGKKFFGAINYSSYKGSDAFGTHVATAKSGKVQDWNWLDKDTKPRAAGERSVRFQLKVADAIERIGGAPLPKRDYSTADLKDEFGLANVQSGNWVLQDLNAAKHHTEQCAMSLQDLSDVLGIPHHEVSLNGRLSIAFGARGSGGHFGPGAAAHYESKYRVINLTKMKGGGALAHEWFHALDDVAGEVETGERKGRETYATEQPGKTAVLKAFNALVFEMENGNHNESVKQKLTLTEAERDHWLKHIERRKQTRFYGAPTTHMVVNAPDLSTAIENLFRMKQEGKFGAPKGAKAEREYQAYKQMAVAHHAGLEGVYDVAGFKKGSKFYVESQKIDAGGKTDYWATRREMAARAFAAYVSDKLHSQKRENTYLTSYADNKYYVLDGIKPYPEGEERHRINQAFDRLFDAVRAHSTLQKALLLTA